MSRVPAPVRWFALVAGVAFAFTAEAKSNITFLHTPAETAPVGVALLVSGNVFGAAELDRATLVFHVGNAPWRRLELMRDGADTWQATIAAGELNGGVLAYYVEATDFFGDTFPVFASVAAPQQVRLVGGRAAPEPGRVEPRPAPKSAEPKPPARRDDPEPPPALSRPAGPARVERWDPDAPAKPAPAKAPAAPSDRRALQDALQMFGAEEPAAPAPDRRGGEAPGDVSVITSEELRAFDLRTLADAVKTLPGFETSRSVQGFWRVATRSRRSDPELLVLLDGHRLNNAFDGRVPWETSLENIERVEVSRGPGGAASGAFAGVIRLFSRRTTGLSASLAAGAFGDVEGSLSGGLQRERLHLVATLEFARRTGYVKTISRDGVTTDPDHTAGVTDDHRLGLGGGLRFDYEGRDGAPSFFGGLRLTNEQRGALVGLIDVVGPASDLAWRQLLLDAGLTVTAGGWPLKLRVFADDNAIDRLFVLFPPGYSQGGAVYDAGVKQETQASLWSGGLEASAARELLAGNTFTLGLVVERQQVTSYVDRANVNSENPTESGALVEPPSVRFPLKDPALAARWVAGLFAEDAWQLAAPLRLTGGVRLDAVSSSGISLNPSLSLVYRPVEAFTARASFARAFRAPTFDEALTVTPVPFSLDSGQPSGFHPDDPLRPVRITSFELGAEVAAAVDGGRASLRGDAFWNEFGDPIEVIDETGTPALVNRAKGVRVLGAEAEGRYDFAHRLGATFVNVSWTRARDLATDETTPDFSLLTDVPQLRANWGLTLAAGGLGTLSLLAQFGSERRNDARTPLEATRRFRIPAYGLFSVVARTRPLFDHVELAASVVNLTDLAYLDDVPRPDDRRMPGLLPREGVHGLLTLRTGF